MAPEDKYRLEAFVTESDEAVTTVNRLAIPFLSIPELKEAFFLDDILMVETEGGTEGFTGLVNVNGHNYSLHNIERLGSIRVEDESGNVQACYLDASLNTRGYASQMLYIQQQFDVFSAEYNFRSAYFSDSSSYGMELRSRHDNGNWSIWIKVNLGVIPSKEARNNAKPLYSFFDNRAVNGVEVEFRPFIVNEEGEFKGVTLTAFLTDKPIQLTYDPDRAQNSCILANHEDNMQTYWINTRDILGSAFTTIYTDGQRSGVAPEGYYSNREFWYIVEGTQGKVTQEGNCSTAGITPEMFGYQFYNTDRDILEGWLAGSSGESIAHIYVNPDDEIIYNNYMDNGHPLFTNPSADGYYGLAIRKNTGGGLPAEPNYGAVFRVLNGKKQEKYEFVLPETPIQNKGNDRDAPLEEAE